MEKNEFDIILPSALGKEINIALMKGDVDSLFSLLADYLDNNNLSHQDAASVLLRSGLKH